MILKIINDNIPDHLALKGELVKTRKANGDKEFYALLKEKIFDDIERVFTNRTAEDRARALSDIYLDLEPLKERLESVLPNTLDELVSIRKERIGLFNDRLVVENSDESLSGGSSKDAKTIVMEFGKANNYPNMVLKRDEHNKPYKTLGSGQKAWESAMGWADLEWPNNENFEDLVAAVKMREIYEGIG